MNLKNLMVDTKSSWVEYPGLEGFELELVHLGRETLIKLRKDSIIQKFDRKTRSPIEELDEKKFIRKFTDASIKNWKGLKLKYLEEFMLVDLSGQDIDSELAYDQDNAHLLVSNSADFDNWLNEVVFDLDNFRTRTERASMEAAGSLAE